MRPLGPSPISRASSSGDAQRGVALAQRERRPEPGVAAADDRHVDVERPRERRRDRLGPERARLLEPPRRPRRQRRLQAPRSHRRDSIPGGSFSGSDGNPDGVRTMFAIYWLHDRRRPRPLDRRRAGGRLRRFAARTASRSSSASSSSRRCRASRSPASTPSTPTSSPTTAAPVSWRDYVLSPDFGGAVLENWQSEFLQFTLFILATVWLVQKGSNESKRLERAGLGVGPRAEGRQPCSGGRTRRGPAAGRVATVRVRELAPARDGDDLPALVGRPVAEQLAGVQRRPARARRVGAPLVRVRARTRTSGSARSRTGSPSSSPSGRWPSSRSTCASAAHRSRSRSAAPHDETAASG